LFKIKFLIRQENNGLPFHIANLKVHAFVIIYFHGTYAFSTEFWAFQAESLFNSFLHIHISLASVTTTKITYLQDCAAAIWMVVSQIRCTTLTLYQVSSIVFAHLKKHHGGHRFQNDVEVQEAVSQWFCLQSPEFCTEGIHLLK
jgi:hypothetical protein